MVSYVFAVAASSCVFFLVCFKLISPYLSGLLVPTYNNLSSKTKVDWNTRTCSTLHAILALIPCVYALLYDEGINSDPIWGESVLVSSICAFVVGYMIADMTVIALNHKEIGESTYYLHHFASIFAYSYAMTHSVVLWITQYRLLAEFSTPFVNLRWVLDVLEHDRTSKLFVSNGILMTVVFFSTRIFAAIPYYLKIYNMYVTLGYDELGIVWFILIISSIVLDILNTIWGYKMYKGVSKMLMVLFRKNSKTK